MSIVEGTVKSVLSDADISRIYYQPSDTTIYAVGEFNGIVKKSLAQIIPSLRANNNVYWDQISDSDVSRLKFNKIVKQGSWLVAIGENSAIRESIDGISWVAPTGLAYTNSWGSLLSAVGNTFYLMAVGGNGAIALRNLSTNSLGASFYNWQLLAANDSLTDKTLRAVANPPGTDEFLVAGDGGTVFKFVDLDNSYTPIQMVKDDPNGVIDPLTKKVKKVNFTADNIIELAHNGSYYLALTANQNNTSYSIYRSTTGEATSWVQVYTTTDHLTSLIWSSGVAHWLVTKSNAVKTRGGLLTSSNGNTWVDDPTLSGGAVSAIDTEYQHLFTLGNQSIYLFGPNKITLLGVAIDVSVPEISVSTNLVSLPITNVGSSNQQSIIITNSGSANLIISNIGFQGANAAAFSISGCSSNVIIPGGSCTGTITFSPSDYGTKTAELFINHNVSDLPEIIYITGEAAEPKISIGLQQIAFDRTAVGATVSQNISINNIGSANLNISSRTITGANASEFSVNGCTGSIAPGGSCTLTVTFSPSTTGGKSASIVINHNAAGGTNTVGLTGEGYVSELVFAPETLTLPGTAVNDSYTANISATNTGAETITISNIALLGSNASDFTANISLPLQVLAGATQPIPITFTPSDAGSRTAQLSVSHSGTNTPGAVYLAGNGIEPGGVAEYEGAIADYFVITYTFVDGRDLDTRTSVLDPAGQSGMLGWSRDGQIGTYLTWGGDNTGTGVESVLFNTVNFKQAFPGRNTITLNFAAFWYGTVGSTPISIDITSYVGGTMVGGSYSWNNPTATSTSTNFVRYQKQITRYNQSSSNNGQQIVQMVLDFVNGTIQFIEVPVISLGSNQLNFGNLAIGAATTQTLRITNQGSANLLISGTSLSNTSDYSISSTCSTPIVPEAYCDLSITYAPTGVAEGERTSNLTITHNATGSPTIVSLSGNARVPRPVLSISSTSITFDSTNLNYTSTKTVTITNTGDEVLILSNVRSTETEFTVSGCLAGLAANESCTLTVQFSPIGTSLTTRTGSILIDSNADTMSRSIELTGPVAPMIANIDITLTDTANLFTVSSSNNTSFITLTEEATVPLTINSTNDASFITLTEEATVPLTITSTNDASFITLTEEATVPLTITSNNISVISSVQSLALFTVSS